jgi:hypothetical protein
MVDRAADELEALTVAVGWHIGTAQQCVSASALLVLAGRHLGYELAPRPVSIAATAPDADLLVVGEPAHEAVAAVGRNNLGAIRPIWGSDFDRAGHMVVTHEDGWLLDPSFRQFSVGGFEDRIIAVRQDAHPAAGTVNLTTPDGLEVAYWFMDDITGCWYDYDSYQRSAESRDVAAVIARQVRNAHR